MPNLRRDLGLSQATFTVIGIVIGSGIFALPAVVLTRAMTPGLALMAWVVAGLVSLAAGLTIAELVAAMPRAGGTYVYLKEAYGSGVGFLQGWTQFIAYSSGVNAALAIMFTNYLAELVPLGATAQKLVGLAMIAGLTLVNAIGVRFGGWIQVTATVGKLVPIVLLILFGLLNLEVSNLGPFMPEHSAGLATAFAGAVLPALWAFDGWMNIGMMAEEVKNPQRNLPLALLGGLGVVTLIYLAFNVALIGMVDGATLAASEKPVLPMAAALFGANGAKLITLGMLVSMFGSMNAFVMTAPRYYFAMARDGLFPGAKQVARLHPKYQTPVAAMVASAVWSAVLLLSGQFGQLLNLVVFVSWVFNTLAMVAVIVLRRTRATMERPYRVWGYPVVPAIGIAAGLWIVGSQFVNDPRTALLGAGLALSGLPVYWWLRRQGGVATGAGQEPEAVAAVGD